MRVTGIGLVPTTLRQVVRWSVASVLWVTLVSAWGCQTSEHPHRAGEVRGAAAPTAVDDRYFAVGNTQLVVGAPEPATPHVRVAGSVLDNDRGVELTVSLATPPVGGTVVLTSDGRFVYTPAAGFRGVGLSGTDVFKYRVVDPRGAAATALVTIDLRDADGKLLLVWYVNAAAGKADGDGTSTHPFASMEPVQAASSEGDVVFVHDDGGLTPGGLVLKARQTLWGNAHPLSIGGGRLVIPAAGRPTLSGPVISAEDATIAALGISTHEMRGLIDGRNQSVADVIVTNDCPAPTAIAVPDVPLLGP